MARASISACCLRPRRATTGRLALKAQGGVPPLTWMVNGAPLKEAAYAQSQRHEARWTPDGAGFARVSVIDANGAGDSVLVRLE